MTSDVSQVRREKLRGMEAAAGQAALRPAEHKPTEQRPAEHRRPETKPEKKKGGVLGWFRSAGEWVSDKYEQVTDAVGGFMYDTAATAKDLWEVARESDVGYSKGVLTVETDLDEVMDLMPKHVRDALMFDRRAAKNRVKVAFDKKKHELVLTSDQIRLLGVTTPQLQTGPVDLRGVRMVFSNHEGGLPFLQGDFELLGHKDKDDNPSLQLSVKDAEVAAVCYRPEAGGEPARVARMKLGELTGNIDVKGGMPLDGQSTMTADFAIERAVVERLGGRGEKLGKAEATSVKAGLDTARESAYLHVGALGLEEAGHGDKGARKASVEGLRLDVDNKGGGLPLLDSVPDHIKAKVGLSAASVEDFHGPRAALSQGHVEGVSGTADLEKGTFGVGLGSARASGLRTSWVDVDTLGMEKTRVEGALGQKDGHTLDLTTDKVRADGVRYDSQPESPRPSARIPMSPVNISAAVGDMEVTNVVVPDARIGRTAFQDGSMRVRVAGNESTYSAKAASAEIQGLDHDVIDFGSIAARDATLAGSQERARVGFGEATLTDVASDTFSARQVVGRGVTSDLDKQRASLSLESGRMSDALVANRVAAGTVEVEELSAAVEGGARSVRVGEGRATGVSDKVSGAKLEALGVKGLALDRAAGGGFDSGVSSLNASGLSVGDARLDEASARDLRVVGADGEIRGGLGSLEGKGLSVGKQLGARTASLGDVAVVHSEKDGTKARVGELCATDLLVAGRVGVDELAARDLGAAHGSGVLTGSLGRADLTGVKDSVTKSSAASVHLEAAGATRAADLTSARIGKGSAQDLVVADRYGAGTLDVEGLGATVEPKGISAGVDRAGAAGILDRASGTRVGEAELQKGRVTFLGDKAHASVDALAGKDISAGDLSVEKAAVAGLTGLRSTEGTSALAKTVSARGVGYDDGTLRAHVASAVGTDGHVRLDAEGASGSLRGLEVADASLTAREGAGAKSKEPSGLDAPALIRTLSSGIDNADAQATIPLVEGKLAGGLSAKEATDANVSLRVRDNRLDRDGTSLRMSKPVDGPLWTTLNGAYIDEKDRLRVDVGGWFDQNAGKKLNESVGLPGDRLYSLGSYGRAAADKLESPVPGSKMTEPKRGEKSLAESVDLGRHRLDATVGLRAGLIDAGSTKVILGERAQDGDNTLHVTSDGQRGLDASAKRLVVDGASAKAAGANVNLGSTTVDAASVKRNKGTTQADIGRIDAKDLSFEKKDKRTKTMGAP